MCLLQELAVAPSRSPVAGRSRDRRGELSCASGMDENDEYDDEFDDEDEFAGNSRIETNAKLECNSLLYLKRSENTVWLLDLTMLLLL